MRKRKFELPNMYVELADGTLDWYIGLHFEEDICESYDVENLLREGGVFRGNCPYFIHYPDGTVYKPLEQKENVYYETPVWDRDRFGILSVDFGQKQIILYTYVPGGKPEILHSLPLDQVKDCYNLKLEMSPWTLGRQTEGVYEMIWPLKKEFPIGENESLICRDGDVLYFSRWIEDPCYQEYVVTVDIATGKELCVEKGSLYLMPDGSVWNI
ncbi:hypothetical protein [Parablautia sp. Marseille-Q6255]|uniref:hypothetical protein n=1 Tax=Parablautia sp. Marseille-Q6255 TaxID=3039593 RepID=UPI0024BCC797|nr:hypothetical protein [Parablautia sp. Marseille-Q6255]